MGVNLLLELLPNDDMIYHLYMILYDQTFPKTIPKQGTLPVTDQIIIDTYINGMEDSQ